MACRSSIGPATLGPFLLRFPLFVALVLRLWRMMNVGEGSRRIHRLMCPVVMQIVYLGSWARAVLGIRTFESS